VLLVGDKAQLSAGEAGAVFAELSSGVAFSTGCAEALSALTGLPRDAIGAMSNEGAGALHDSVVWLTENFRFARDSGRAPRPPPVNAGAAAAAIAALRDGAATNVHWIDDAGVMPAADTLATIAAGYGGDPETLANATPHPPPPLA